MTAASIKLGEGTPPSSAPGQGVLYFDDSDQQLYVIDAGGNTVGPITGGGGTNATSLQGYDVGITPPTNGQVLTWDDVGSEWIPGTPAATSLQGAYNEDNLILVGAPGGPANGVIIGLNPAAVGVPATLTVGCDLAGGDAIKVDVGGSATGRGINLDMAGGTSNAGIRVSQKGSGAAVAIEQTGSGIGVAITQSSPAAGVSVFRSGIGNTAIDGSGIGTPKVVFNGNTGAAARVEILGDPGNTGLLGQNHYNPRVRINATTQDLGALVRIQTAGLGLSPGVAELSTIPGFDLCTVFEVVTLGAGVILGLPDSSLYPYATEILIINADASNSIDVKAAGIGPKMSIITLSGAAVPGPITVNADTGLRLIARNNSGWTITGTF